jgi:hypothetical protein
MRPEGVCNNFPATAGDGTERRKMLSMRELRQVRRHRWMPDQWRNCRCPVNTIAMPCSSAAAITSSSRTEPPGCTMPAPRFGRLVHAVPEGEERVGAQRRPPVSCPAGAPCGTARNAGVHARHLTRADADRGAVACEHDRVRLHAGHRAPGEDQIARSSSVGARRVTTFPPSSPITGGSPVLHQQCRRARACSPSRHANRRVPLRGRAGSSCVPGSRAPASLYSGATMHSTKRLETASAAASSTGTVNAITEPKARHGSQASAFRYASSGAATHGEPQGVVCLMIAHAARRRTDRWRAARLRGRADC